MKQLRTRALILVLWLVGLYLLVHFSQLISVSPNTFVYALLLTAVFLGAPHLNKVNFVSLIVLPAVIYLGIQALMDLPLTGSALSNTVIGTLAIIFTSLLLVWVREPVYEFENAVASLTFKQPERIIETASEGQSILYREVRRARNHQRPLSIMAVAVDENTMKGSVDRMVKEAQFSIIRQYTLSDVSRTLCDKLEDCDIVVQTNNHFLVVLPETKPEDLPGLIERLQKQIAEQVGVEIKVGTASLPQDSFTLEGLLDKATMELQGSMQTKLYIEPEQLFAKRKPVDHSS